MRQILQNCMKKLNKLTPLSLLLLLDGMWSRIVGDEWAGEGDRAPKICASPPPVQAIVAAPSELGEIDSINALPLAFLCCCFAPFLDDIEESVEFEPICCKSPISTRSQRGTRGLAFVRSILLVNALCNDLVGVVALLRFAW